MTEFQIQKITGPLLVRDLFDIHAPSLGVGKKWAALSELGEVERAWKLGEMLKGLSKTNLHERDTLYAHLGSIEIIGSDSRQTEAIEKMITSEPALNERYIWADFGIPKGRRKRELSRTPHNLAAWIDVVAHTPEKSKAYSASAIAGAKRIYDRLQKQVASISAEVGTCTFFLTSRPEGNLHEPEKTAVLFERAYRKYRTEITGIPNYPAVVSPSIRTGYVRYSVNMAPNPNISLQVHKGEFLAKQNPNADNFRLDYHPLGDYVRISRVVDRETSKRIVKLFAEQIGCTVQDFRKKRCSLKRFDGMNPPATPLGKDALKRGDKMWVSAIESAYLDSMGNIVSKNRELEFPCEETSSIYDNLRIVGTDAGTPDSSRVGRLAEKRVTTAVWLTFLLHDFREFGGKRLFDSKPMKPITIKVSPGHNEYPNKTKDLKPYHRDMIIGALKALDTLPKNRDEFNESQEP